MIRFRGWGILFTFLFASTTAWAAEGVRAFGKGGSISHYFPPPRIAPGQMPAFQHDEPQIIGDRLDQFDWIFVKDLYDADTANVAYDPDTLDAVPTGILFFPSNLRAYICTFHTIFVSYNGGISWQNADVYPVPNPNWAFASVRRPNYIYGLTPYSSDPNHLHIDPIYIVNSNSSTYHGYVRRASFLNPSYPSVESRAQLERSYWLGHLVLPDTLHMAVFGSWDGFASSFEREHVDGTWEETHFDTLDGWVTGPMTYMNGFVYLEGTSQWVSFDSGRTWQVRPCADEVFDGGVAFVDTLCGWTGGGRIAPVSEGWVHRTTDRGLTWSGRLLETSYPIRTVHFLDRNYGFAAGGNYQEGVGGIWSTTDGGETWHEDLAVAAEITVLGSRRYNLVYMDIFAAGFYPDFVGGVWRSRLLFPDTALVALPDTLDFGAILPGERDTLSFWAINFGSDSIGVSGFYVSDTVFKALPDTTVFEVAPRDSVEIPVEFHPILVGTHTATIYVFNSESQDVRLTCRGEGRDLAAESSQSLLPQEPSVSVYPNPGNPNFSIIFNLPTRSDIRLAVYNVLGQQVAVLAYGWHDAGSHQLIWQADGLPSGIYFVRLDGIPSPKMVKLCLVR
jgi:hypothetical protein